jgi:hypothetical protein
MLRLGLLPTSAIIAFRTVVCAGENPPLFLHHPK